MANRGRGRPKGRKGSYTMSEKTLAQRRAATTLVPAGVPPEEMDYNSRLIEYSLKVQQLGASVDIADPVCVRSAFLTYLELSQKYGFKVSNLSASAAIGVSQTTLDNWINGQREEYREIARMIKTTCALSREQLISDNKINPVIGIFWQRNFDGLRNDTEQRMDAEETNDVDAAKEYKKKYEHLLTD